MPKSKYKYYKSIINNSLYRSPIKNTTIIEGYVENLGWILLQGEVYPTLADLQNNPFVVELTEYQALHVDMFGDDL